MLWLIFSSEVISQVLADDRAYDWKNSGFSNKIDFYDTLNALDFGLTNDGFTENDNKVFELISGISQASVLYFPPGSYKFISAINLKSNIIVTGAGYKETKFIFDLGGKNDLIKISGNALNDTFEILSNVQRYDSAFVVYNTEKLNVGDLILLFDKDDEKITSDWAKATTGQICKIKYIGDAQIFIEGQFRRGYKIEDNPRFVKLEPIENCGIEKLSIERLDATVSQTSNILFQFATNCFVRCIESKNSNFSHIAVNRSSNITIEGSYFHHAFAYGGGGQAYGVMLQSSSGQCLVYNNIFEHLRHSMILQSGANGNVFAYNYSIDPYWTDVALPANSAGDIVLHGNYPYANLFESNVCQNIIIDNSHGINGPHNTFFRNRANLYGIFMNSNPASDGQNFIGNEITNSELLKGLYFLNGNGHFEFGNNVKGRIIPDGTNELSDSSYYLNSRLSWYMDNSKFPPIGLPNSINQFKIETEDRYEKGLFTACDIYETTVESHLNNITVNIYPQPANDYIRVASDITIKRLVLAGITGNSILTGQNSILDVRNIVTGIYLLQIIFEDNSIIQKPVIIIK